MSWSRVLMLRGIAAAILLSVTAAAQAQFPGSVPDTFRLNAGGMYAWFNTDVTFEQNGGAGAAVNLGRPQPARLEGRVLRQGLPELRLPFLRLRLRRVLAEPRNDYLAGHHLRRRHLHGGGVRRGEGKEPAALRRHPVQFPSQPFHAARPHPGRRVSDPGGPAERLGRRRRAGRPGRRADGHEGGKDLDARSSSRDRIRRGARKRGLRRDPLQWHLRARPSVRRVDLPGGCARGLVLRPTLRSRRRVQLHPVSNQEG